jgi:hypothetical protein
MTQGLLGTDLRNILEYRRSRNSTSLQIHRRRMVHRPCKGTYEFTCSNNRARAGHPPSSTLLTSSRHSIVLIYHRKNYVKTTFTAAEILVLGQGSRYMALSEKELTNNHTKDRYIFITCISGSPFYSYTLEKKKFRFKGSRVVLTLRVGIPSSSNKLKWNRYYWEFHRFTIRSFIVMLLC